MERSLLVRLLSYLAVTVVAVLLLVPSAASWMGRDQDLPPWLKNNLGKKIMLGLDLQGGLHLVYEVQVDKAVSDKADRLASDIEEKLRKEKKVVDVHADREGTTDIILKFKNPADLAKLDHDFMRDYQKYLYEERKDADKGEIVFRMEGAAVDELRDYAIRQGVETIRNRVDKLAVAEPSILRKGTDIVVELPGLLPEDFEHVKNLIGRTAQLEFKMNDDGSEYMRKVGTLAQGKKAEFPGIDVGNDGWEERDSKAPHGDVYLRSKDRAELEKFFASINTTDDKVPADHEIGYEQMRSRNGDDDAATATPQTPVWRTYYLHRRAEMTGEYITDAEVDWDRTTGSPEVSITFDREGANLFEKASGSNIGRKMAIILDEKVNSAPVIETKIGGGKARITMGGFGDAFARQQEAKDLVAVLRTGALPAPLKKTFETQVGPTLGRDAVEKAKVSMIIGALAVILFMLLYYRMAGLIANVAMALNILYQLAILALLGATLTLPGIAGVVLTIGMAVDANIIFYERIREELRAGKSIRGAVEAGFGRAFVAVFDAHITSLVAGIVLYSYGTGPIRGFAVTLMIGVIANLFTSVWLSRAMFDALLSGKKTGEGKGTFGTWELVPPHNNYNFVGRMNQLLAVSVTLCLASLALLPINHYVRGRALNFSIDFRGGSEVQVAFAKETDPTAIRAAMDAAGHHDSEVVKINDSQHPNSFLLRFGAVSTVSTQKAAELEAALRAKFGDKNVRRFEFSDGGDKVYARFNTPVEPADIAAVFKDKGVSSNAVQRFGRPEENNFEVILVGLDIEIKRALEEKLGPGSVSQILGVESVGAKAGSELRDDGIKSLLFAILCIMVYVAIRFDFRYGPGTVVALLHDALLTMGAFALTGREFSLTTIAAILTVIGYSMNDTIVVFDRIRENLARMRDKKFETVVNTAINETMSRTILTSATVFFVTMAMYVFGVGVIKDFAFAMNIGVVVGTYSSVFVATPILIWLHYRTTGAPAKKSHPTKK